MKTSLLVAGLFIMLSGCQSRDIEPLVAVDSLYINGNIITMVDNQRKAEAIAIKDGLIYALGDKETLLKYQGENTSIVDLAGKTLMPGFIDPHSHFSTAIFMSDWVSLLSPPFGDVTNISDIRGKLQQHIKAKGIKKGQWIIGYGYDSDLLDEKRHLNKLDLDQMFPNTPIFINHVSMHMGVVNSKGLELLNITEQSVAPEGGSIVRMPRSNNPSGLLLEKSHSKALLSLPRPAIADLLNRNIKAAQQLYASQGITTAQDGFSDKGLISLLQAAAYSKKLYIDLSVLVGTGGDTSIFDSYNFANSYSNHLKFGGIKIGLDGSPQGKTAYFSEPYLNSHNHGTVTVNQQTFNDVLLKAYQNNVQAYVHANGDGAVDMVLEGHKQADIVMGHANSERRTVVVHSQFMRHEQLDRYSEYGFIPSYFSNHAFFWGDVHIKNLGQKRAEFLSPMATSLKKGIIFTNHTDFPITPINHLLSVTTAVERKTRSGQILGADERINIWQALKAITINSAYQYREENSKGSLQAGKLADLVILSQNPLTVAPQDIKDIKVVETIKRGKTIFKLTSRE